MKKTIAITAVLAVASLTQASQINLGGNFATGIGGGVYEYVDADGDSAGVFNTGFTAYVINSSTLDSVLVDGSIDLAAVLSSAVGSSPIFTKTAGPGQKTSLTGISVSVPDNTDVYTVLVNDAGTAAMILDAAPVNAGAFDPAVQYTPTKGVNVTDITIAMGTQDWVATDLGGFHVLSVQSDHGMPNPGVGTYQRPTMPLTFSVASPVVENGTNFVCTGWTGTGSIPSSGSSNSTGQITLSTDSSITWNWDASNWLDVTVVGGGSLNVADGWYSAGASQPLTATPGAGWLFMGWSGDIVGDYTTASTNVLMDAAKSITATFSYDADGDGLTNTQEDALGTDPRDSDSDDDLISDSAEVSNGLDPLISNVDVDSDSDGLNDAQEVNSLGTDPLDTDTDNDNLTDSDEVYIHSTDPLDSDTDNDLIRDDHELANGLNPLVSNTGQDSDTDNLSDAAEVNTYGTNPLSNDTDGDMLLDFAEIFTYGTDPNLADTDADGLTDHTEIFATLTSPFNADTDADGLSDGDEVNVQGTNPKDNDSDDDGLSDGDEVNTYGTDPLDADTDNDGLTDGDEISIYFTIPTNPDTDNDGASDGDEVNIYGTDPNDNLSDADMDEDGIYDVWERQHFGVIENCDPSDDPDGDLYTNIEEFNNDTDPNVFDIYLAHDTAIELWYKAATGVTYQVQATSNLASGVWTDVGEPVIGDGAEHSVLESTRPAPNKSYRVNILP